MFHLILNESLRIFILIIGIRCKTCKKNHYEYNVIRITIKACNERFSLILYLFINVKSISFIYKCRNIMINKIKYTENAFYLSILLYNICK